MTLELKIVEGRNYQWQKGDKWVWSSTKKELEDLREMPHVGSSPSTSLKDFPWVKYSRETSDFDEVVKPKHYHITVKGTNGVSVPVDCWAVIDALGFDKYHYAATALAYLWRYQEKGNPVQDLDKCIQNLQKEMNRLKNQTKEG